VNRRLAYALLAMAAGQAAVYVARPTTSYRLLSLGYDTRDVGLVAAAYALLPLVVAIPLGRFSDRRHAGSLIGAGCALEVASCAALAFARTPLELAAASTLLGLGHLAVALGVQDVIARESHADHHDQHFGLLTAGVSGGQLVGPLVAGLVLGDRSGSALTAATSRAMLVAGGIAALAALCGFLAQRRPPQVAGITSRDGRTGSLASILTIPGVPAGILASVAVLAAADVFTAYMPVLGEERGIGPGAVGVLLATRAAASMGARIGIGPLVRWIGRMRLIAVSAVAAALAYGAVTLFDNIWLLGVLSVVAGIGLGFGQPLSMTIVAQLVPEPTRATALAVRLTGNRIGQVAAPAAAGALAGSAGTAAVFWLMSAMLLASAVAIGPRGRLRSVAPAPGRSGADLEEAARQIE
jgi:MFS family permease